MTAAESFGVCLKRFAPCSQKLHRRTHTYVTGYWFSCLFACSYNGFKVVSASVLSRVSASKIMQLKQLKQLAALLHTPSTPRSDESVCRIKKRKRTELDSNAL